MPGDLTFFAASRRHFLQNSCGAALLAAWPLPFSAEHDPFGGLSGQAIAPPGQDFRMVRAGERWLFATPAGNAFWMRGVFDVNLSDSQYLPDRSYLGNILAKYGTETVWGRQIVRRLRRWGFNTLAEYSSSYTLPLALHGRPANPVALPFMSMIRPSSFCLLNRWNLARGPVKNIVAATDSAIYTGWRKAGLPDVYDPLFAEYASAEASRLAYHLPVSSYLIGVATDDTDNLYGFGPGPAFPTDHVHPHIGWLVLIANPNIPRDAALGVSYADPRLHAKYALRDWLRHRYSSLAALNRAWGARYTSFASDGGWPKGHGWLDESGRNPWVGRDANLLAAASPALRADLDAFLYDFARQYFQSVCPPIRRYFPGKLVFGPATLNGWGGLTRPPILAAAGKYLDVVQANAESAEILNATLRAAGERPLVSWAGMAANADSDLFGYAPPPGTLSYATQAARGAAYAAVLERDFSQASTSGLRAMAGMKFWALVDSWPEKTNWGLVTFLDNAYDGCEATRLPGRDPWGFRTGGEIRDYGDCLSAIQAANHKLEARLSAEIARRK